jgi:hypothetical protein
VATLFRVNMHSGCIKEHEILCDINIICFGAHWTHVPFYVIPGTCPYNDFNDINLSDRDILGLTYTAALNLEVS